MPQPREVWNARYSDAAPGIEPGQYSSWLERWAHLLPTDGRVLDIACGRGEDALYLTGKRFSVIAGDFSAQALGHARRAAPLARLYQADFSLGLPFRDASFSSVIANLCIHYFSRDKTIAIVRDIRRCLSSRGLLFCRVNSTKDVNYGACGHPEIESGFYQVGSCAKRFYDEQRLRDLFDHAWEILNIEEYETRYGSEKPKVMWELVARKASKSPALEA